MDYEVILSNITWLLLGFTSMVCVVLAIFCQWMDSQINTRNSWDDGAITFWVIAGVSLIIATIGGWPLSGPVAILFLLTVFISIVGGYGWIAWKNNK